MSLIKWEPFDELKWPTYERLLSPFPKLSWELAVDVYEEQGNVVAKMSLPGVKPDEVEIFLEEDVLTITGNREEEKETKEREYYSKEIQRGSFTRATTLPTAVEEKEAKAKFEDGLLVITMPKKKTGKQTALKVPVTGQ